MLRPVLREERRRASAGGEAIYSNYNQIIYRFCVHLVQKIYNLMFLYLCSPYHSALPDLDEVLHVGSCAERKVCNRFSVWNNFVSFSLGLHTLIV